jgi:hypothetical protein
MARIDLWEVEELRGFRESEKGISAIVGFVFIVALVMTALSVYLTQQMPYEWKQAEYNTMEDVKNSFFELRERIHELERGEVAAAMIKMGTLAPTAYVSLTTTSELQVVTARSVSDIDEAQTDANFFEEWRGYGTYVKEDDPTWNYSSATYENDYLIVSTTEERRIWTFLKFDLTDSGLFNEAIVENQTQGFPLSDNYVSFVLREPYWANESNTTSLQTRTAFNSVDNTYAEANDFDPRIRIVYSRSGRMGYTRTSSLPYGYHSVVNFGYIRYRANNERFPDTNYVYEGGLLTIERGTGWYQTILAYPPEFVTVTPADGNNVHVRVTRYQIKESNLGGESVSGTGTTAIRVARVQEDWKVMTPSAPNASEVTITVVSHQPRVWRDYLERLAAEVNHVLADYEPGSFYTYGDYVDYDYDTVSLTIKGKDLELGVQDIYYSERVIWLDVTIGYFQGGRT